MARPKEPRTVVLEAFTEVRRETLSLAKVWKNRNVDLSKWWYHLSVRAAYLSAIFDEMHKFALRMEAEEKARGN